MQEHPGRKAFKLESPVEDSGSTLSAVIQEYPTTGGKGVEEEEKPKAPTPFILTEGETSSQGIGRTEPKEEEQERVRTEGDHPPLMSLNPEKGRLKSCPRTNESQGIESGPGKEIPGQVNPGSEDQRLEEEKKQARVTLDALLLLQEPSRREESLLIIQGQVNGFDCKVMIDSGATLNFISQQWVQQHQLETLESEMIEIHLANGTTLPNSQAIHQAHLKLHNYQDFFSARVLGMDKFDLILGKPWLRKVNPRINWKRDTVVIKQDKIQSTLKAIKLPSAKSKKICSLHGLKWSRRIEDDLLSKQQFRKEVKQGHQVWCTFVKAERLKQPELQEKPFLEQEKKEQWSQVDIFEGPRKHDYLNLCKRFKRLFRDELPDGLPPERSVDHEIKLAEASHPPKKKLYRLSWQEEEVLKLRVEELLAKGLIRPSKSPYGAPVLFTKKKDGGLRMCVDYRALNTQTIKNSYPLPRVDQMFDRLYQSSIFSTLDCTSGYHQIRIKPEDVEKTAFNTRYGQFEYLVVPFGLCNAPATFQKMVHEIFLKFLDEFLEIFIDDLLIHSQSEDEHLEHLKKVLTLCEENELFIKPQKCKLGYPEVEWVGHVLSENGQAVNQAKIRAVVEWDTPQSVTQVRGFLGLCSYYRKFVKGFASKAIPLQKLLKKESKFCWNQEAEASFQELKAALTTTPVLSIPSPNLEFEMKVDASGKAVGAVLEQAGHPVAFFSKTLNSAEQRYATHEQETLAIVYALKQWRVYLLGRPFIVWSDHYSLKYLRTQPNLSGRQARWLCTLEQYDFTLKYIKGKSNTVADALSRKDIVVEEKWFSGNQSNYQKEQPQAAEVYNLSGIRLKDSLFIDLKDGYEKDKFTRDTINQLQTLQTTHLKEKFELKEDLLYLKENPDGKLRLVIPRVPQLLAKVLFELHDTPLAGHLGITKVYEKAKEHFYWPRMFRTIHKYISSCDLCQRCKPSQQAPGGLLQPLEVPDGPWNWITMDFVVKLPKTPAGNEQAMVIVDRFTKKVHYIPLSGTATAVDVASAFFTKIVCQYGLPSVITSDRDSKFTSKFWQALHLKLGTKLAMATAFHQQTDGESERVIKDFKIRARIFSNYQQTNWEENIPYLEFVHNSTSHSATGHSPNYLNCGKETEVPGVLLTHKHLDSGHPSLDSFLDQRRTACQDAKESLQYAQDVMARYSNPKRTDIDFSVGEKVLLDATNLKLANQLKRPSLSLMEKFIGPYIIEAKVGKLSYQLKLPKTMQVHPVFHVSLLKKYTSPNMEFSGRKIAPPVPEKVEDQEFYTVEKILDKRLFRGKIQYLVSWKGYDSHDNTWQYKTNLEEDGCSYSIQEYERDKAKEELKSEQGNSGKKSKVKSLKGKTAPKKKGMVNLLDWMLNSKQLKLEDKFLKEEECKETLKETLREPLSHS